MAVNDAIRRTHTPLHEPGGTINSNGGRGMAPDVPVEWHAECTLVHPEALRASTSVKQEGK
jgi:hypothetical protein